MRYTLTPSRNKRRGVILLVVITMLMVFATVGLAFVLYSEAAAKSARIYREAMNQSEDLPSESAQEMLEYALSQLIYDAPDLDQYLYSAMRGQSISRNMYGLNYTLVPQANGTHTVGMLPNTMPFDGTGKLHNPETLPGITGAVDTHFLVNFTWHQADGFLRDPERLGFRGGPPAANQPDNRGPFTGGFNPSYTYPDLNCMFLAAVTPEGRVLMPSFHRDYTQFGPLAPTNPNWSNVADRTMKYRVLRHMPVNMGPGFPTTTAGNADNPGGDVKNLINSPFPGNDSIWLDLGHPVRQTRTGRKYKPMFAFLVVDLDNRVNVNLLGNVLGQNTGGIWHVSNQNWGKWEADLVHVLGQPEANGRPGYANLFLGNGAARGRYGLNGIPDGFPYMTGNAPHVYARVDYNGWNAGTGFTNPLALPGVASFSGFPTYPPGYNDGAGGPGENEQLNHPLKFHYHHRATSSNNLLYNPPGGSVDDLVFLPGEMRPFLARHSYERGTTAQQASTLGQLAPVNLATGPTGSPADVLAAYRRANMITTLSMDIDRPGVSPWLWDFGAAASPYRYDTTQPQNQNGQGYPKHDIANTPTATAFPPLTPRNNPPANRTDFTNDWKGLLAALGRIDLNRSFRSYPAFDPASGVIPPAGLPAFSDAEGDRQILVREIFDRLCFVCGLIDPILVGVNPPQANPAFAAYTAGSPEYDAARWLAQLAVNMVDYIDSDDYMTPFNWNPAQTANVRNGWVHGTELPRLVLNEAYIQYRNDPADPNIPPLNAGGTMASRFLVDVWAELHNAMAPDANQPTTENGATRLTAYQLVLGRTNPGGMGPAPMLRDRANVLGDPDGVWTMPPPAMPPANNCIVGATEFGTIMPAANQVLPPGAFFIVGPTTPFPKVANQPNPPSYPTANLAVAQMTYSVLPLPMAPRTIDDEIPVVMLRRLACPHLPPNQTLGAGYNPYITVDYMDPARVLSPMQRAASFTATGMQAPPAENVRFSLGRRQPYAAITNELRPQAPNPAETVTPQHTLGRHNIEDPTTPNVSAATLKRPFDWLTHLDRHLISPMEVLNVSAYKPHELTQQFVGVGGNAHQQRAPWFDQEARIHRLFEFLTTRDRMTGTSFGGRTPGKVNINTVWSAEVFRALCAPNAASKNYGIPEANAIFQQLLTLRTPGYNQSTGQGSLTALDSPFQGLGTSYTPKVPGVSPSPGDLPPGDRGMAYPGKSINDTLFRAFAANGNAASPRLFDLPPGTPPHRYMQEMLLTQIFNHLTTRSNTFAVWVTVGFFEVTNDQVQPVRLGPEFGAAQNRQVRHRLFAMVDRTNLAFDKPDTAQPQPLQAANRPIFFSSPLAINRPTGTPVGTQPGAVAVPVTHGRQPGPGIIEIDYEGAAYQIRVGTQLLVDTGLNQEVPVTVTAINPLSPFPGLPGQYYSFTATFTKEHGAGCAIQGYRQPGALNMQPSIVLGAPGPLPPNRIDLTDTNRYGGVIPVWVILD